MMDKAETYQKKIQLKNSQRELNRDYEKHGLTDEILNRQIQLNKLRNKYDITDETETIHEQYVQ